MPSVLPVAFGTQNFQLATLPLVADSTHKATGGIWCMPLEIYSSYFDKQDSESVHEQMDRHRSVTSVRRLYVTVPYCPRQAPIPA